MIFYEIEHKSVINQVKLAGNLINLWEKEREMMEMCTNQLEISEKEPEMML